MYTIVYNLKINNIYYKQTIYAGFMHFHMLFIFNQIFETFDDENQGIVDQFEFVTALALLCKGNFAEKTEVLYKIYDYDKS